MRLQHTRMGWEQPHDYRKMPIRFAELQFLSDRILICFLFQCAFHMKMDDVTPIIIQQVEREATAVTP